MKNVFGAIVITAAALATTAAFAESTVDEQRARLANLWGQDKAVTTSRAAGPQSNFTGISSVLDFETIGPWAGNHGAGRVDPPAGH